MKLFSTYIKEMKIASRGFYFYIEIFVAVIALIILLVAVKENPDGKAVEYLYSDMPSEVMESYYAENSEKGNLKIIEDTLVTLN